MKNEKLSLYYLLIPVIAAMFVGYLITEQSKEVRLIAQYKPGFYNNCSKNIKEADQALIINGVNDQKLENDNKIIINDYQKSECVNLVPVVYQQTIKIDSIKIDHQKGRNDQTYQSSYETIKTQLNKKKDLNSLEKQLLKTLNAVQSDQKLQDFLPLSFNAYLTNQKVIGPTSKDASGVYVLSLELGLIKNEIYQIKDQQKDLVKTVYTFDSIKQKYIKEAK